MKIEVISLGCPKNLVDTETLLGEAAQAGHQICGQGRPADALLINTCAFIKEARAEAYSEIGKGIRQKARGKYKYIIIAGCLPQLEKQKLLKKFPQIDEIILPKEIWKLADQKISRLQAAPLQTAYLKIAEGCNNNCAYCLVPAIRGRFKSKEFDKVIAEAEFLAHRGVKELILIAQDTTRYPKLPQLLKRLAEIAGIEWIRLMYAHPRHLKMEVMEVMAKEAKICHYLDLPLQHSSDRILKRMGRGVSRDSILNLIKKIRRRIPDLAVRSSFIVGFPGEKEDDFLDLLDFIREVKFDKIGVFKYSRENGTPAARLRGQVPEKLKQKRFHKLMSLQNRIAKELNLKLIGKVLDILVEDNQRGRSFREAPGIDGFVYLENSRKIKPGQIIPVKITRASAYDLAGFAIT